MAGVEWYDWQGDAVADAEREAQAVALAQQAMAWDAPVTEVKADGEMLIVAVVERDVNGPSVQVYDCTIRRRGRVLP